MEVSINLKADVTFQVSIQVNCEILFAYCIVYLTDSGRRNIRKLEHCAFAYRSVRAQFST